MLLAFMVVFSHAWMLGGFGPDPLGRITRNQENFGFLGVTMFFVLSGFLITRSASRIESLARFFWHRFLRIFPGYCALLLISAFVFAPLYYRVEFGSYLGVFSAPGSPAVSYFAENVGMFHGDFRSIANVMNVHPASIATLFLNNPYPRIFNGSLWSLPYECLCYFGVGLIALLGVLKGRRHLVLVGVFLLAALYAFDCVDPQSFAQCFPSRGFGVLVMLAFYFGSGTVAYLYRERIQISWVLFGACLTIAALSVLFGTVRLTAPLIFPYLLLWLMCRLPICRFDALGDFSYGTYIYAFPLQQGLVLLGAHRGGLLSYFFASCALTLLFAVLSYHLVEAPALRLKKVDLAQILQRIGARLFPARALAGAKTAAD